jgi:signal transduction histidine kinase
VKLRSWSVLALGFGTLVVLILLSGLDNSRRAGRIYSTIVSVHQSHARTEDALRDIESQVYLSSIYARDFLLDLSDLMAESHRDELVSIRKAMDQDLALLERSDSRRDRKLVGQLRHEVDAYWSSLEPILTWTSAQKLMLSTWFLRKQVLPRRQAVLRIAREAKMLNASDLADRQMRMDQAIADFRSSAQRTLAAVMVLGIAVALASIARVARLESRAEQQHRATEHAEAGLRRLSRKLVKAQEDERRAIARELHDEVGQTITALRVELANAEKLRSGPDEAFRHHLEEAKELAARTLRTVRDLATGLRPSVLDDLGVAPALEWQARQHTRRTGTPVEVSIDQLPEHLPEGHRTCLYRVVQEALTNCARHAEARQIHVALHAEVERLLLTVEDDGRGFPSPPPGGLGLIGIEERVRELGGTLGIDSQPGKGTVLKISLPLPKGAAA